MTLELYHYETSTCSQKVRLVLAEKRIAWISHPVNLRTGEQQHPEYLKLNPDGVVPTLVHHGHVVRESAIIAEYLEDLASEPALRPKDPLETARMRLWIRRVDDTLHPACGALTYAATAKARAAAIRAANKTIAEHLANVPNAARRKRQTEALELGAEAPIALEAVRQHAAFLADTEQQLSSTAYLAGASFTLADTALLPYLIRLQMLDMSELWASLPAVARWLDLLCQRPSYREAIERFNSPATLELLKTGGREAWAILKPKMS